MTKKKVLLKELFNTLAELKTAKSIIRYNLDENKRLHALLKDAVDTLSTITTGTDISALRAASCLDRIDKYAIIQREQK